MWALRALTGKADITTFYLNTKWLAPSLYQQKADEALTFFHRIKPDVVMLRDDNALWDECRSMVRKAGEFDVVVMPVFHTLKDGSGARSLS